MKFTWVLVLGLVFALGAGAQNPSPPRRSQPPPRTDQAADNSGGYSSSKESNVQVVLPGGQLQHSEDAQPNPGSSEVQEMTPWDPHRAAKDIEVGDFYFGQKNFKAAEARYRDALKYKPNDAVATFRLAQTLGKREQPAEAARFYAAYLRILPNGEFAGRARQALKRLGVAEKTATSPSAGNPR